jgi:hypothetical protein
VRHVIVVHAQNLGVAFSLDVWVWMRPLGPSQQRHALLQPPSSSYIRPSLRGNFFTRDSDPVGFICSFGWWMGGTMPTRSRTTMIKIKANSGVAAQLAGAQCCATGLSAALAHSAEWVPASMRSLSVSSRKLDPSPTPSRDRSHGTA